jgi:hypothetical protein
MATTNDSRPPRPDSRRRGFVHKSILGLTGESIHVVGQGTDDAYVNFAGLTRANVTKSGSSVIVVLSPPAQQKIQADAQNGQLVSKAEAQTRIIDSISDTSAAGCPAWTIVISSKSSTSNDDVFACSAILSAGGCGQGAQAVPAGGECLPPGPGPADLQYPGAGVADQTGGQAQQAVAQRIRFGVLEVVAVVQAQQAGRPGRCRASTRPRAPAGWRPRPRR